MSVEWFVVDTRSGAIINCVTTQGPAPRLDFFLIPEQFLKATTSPTPEQLERYEYWRSRS